MAADHRSLEIGEATAGCSEPRNFEPTSVEDLLDRLRVKIVTPGYSRARQPHHAGREVCTLAPVCLTLVEQRR